MMRGLVLTFVLAAASITTTLAGQQPAPTPRPFSVAVKIGANDYNVAPDWALPYPKDGYAWGSVPGIFVESDERIFVASRGEIKLPSPLPASFRLLAGGPTVTAFAAVPFLVFTAPFIIMRNTIRGRQMEHRRFTFVMMATIFAGFWSLMSGTFVVMALQAAGFIHG